MKPKKLAQYLALFATGSVMSLGLSSCIENSTSQVQDIATDLDGEGTAPLALFFTEGEVVNKANCREDLPPTRVSCDDVVASMAEGQFREQLSDGLASTVDQLEEDLAAIDRDIESIEQDLAVKQPQRRALQTRLDNANGQQTTARAEIDDLNAEIEAKLAQISSIEQQLQENNDPALRAQLDSLREEVRTSQSALEAATRSLIDAENAISEVPPLLATLDSEISALTQRFAQLSTQQEEKQGELDEASTDINLVDDILEKLRDGIVYRVLAGDTASSEQMKRFVAKFNSILIDGSLQPSGELFNVEVDGAIRFFPFQGNNVLQFFNAGEWRGVCDDSFQNSDATQDKRNLEVICRQAGLPIENTSFISVQGPNNDFWVDDLRCDGSEDRIGSCSHSGLGTHNCGSSEYVVVNCAAE